MVPYGPYESLLTPVSDLLVSVNLQLDVQVCPYRHCPKADELNHQLTIRIKPRKPSECELAVEFHFLPFTQLLMNPSCSADQIILQGRI